MRFHILFLLTGLLLSPLTATAQQFYPAPDYSRQQTEQAPGVLLREGIEKLLAFLEGGGADDREKLVAFVERELAPYFDFVSMTRWSLGPRGRYLNPEQRADAVNQLRSMFLSALVRNLMSYEPGRVQYLPPRNNPYSGEMMLSVQSFPRQGYPMRLDFYFQRNADGWRVVDVAANGLKATTVYREYFQQSARGPGPGYYR